MHFPFFGKKSINPSDGGDNNGNGSWVPYTIATCSAVVLFSILNNISSIGTAASTIIGTFKPIIIGLAIAYMLNPLVKLIEKLLESSVRKEKIRNWIAIAIAFAAVVLFASVLLYSLIPQLIDSILQFFNNINNYANTLNSLVNELAGIAESKGIDVNTLRDASSNFVTDAVTMLTGFGGKMVGQSFSLGSDALGILIGFILAIYFLVSKNMLLDGINRLMDLTLKQERCKSIRHFLGRCNVIVSTFIIDDLLDALIVGIVNFVFMTVMHMPYSVLISVVVAVTNLAPTFGPFVGGFIGGFVLLFASAGSTIPFIIFTIILQLCDGYIIKPKLFGQTLGVPGIWMVSGIIIGGELFGVLGILLAVPVVGIMTFVYRDYIAGLEAKKKAELEAKQAEEAKIQAEMAEIEHEMAEEDIEDNVD